MRYWLFKSEPDTWSWDNQVAKGETGEEWDGVRNYQARNFMREMSVGDRGFFYHSQKTREIVGIVEVCAEAHPDSTTDDDRWECVDISSCEPLADDDCRVAGCPSGQECQQCWTTWECMAGGSAC